MCLKLSITDVRLLDLLPDSTREPVSKDAKLETNKQASKTPRAVAINSLGLQNTDTERTQVGDGGQTATGALSASLSPVSARKGQIETEHQADESKVGTPNSVCE